eukprot:COSAG02_NODE_6984_length_3248_cov_2.215624_2_plen_86_part_00
MQIGQNRYVWSAMISCLRSQVAFAQPLFNVGWSLATTLMPQQTVYFFFLQAPLALARIIDGGMPWYGDESPASMARCMMRKSSGS